MESTRELLIRVLKSYWHVLIVAVLLGLLIPGQSVALALVAFVLVRVHRKSSELQDPWPFRLFAAGIGLRLALIVLKFTVHHFWGIGLGFFGDSRMHLSMADFAGKILAGDTLMGDYGTTMLIPGSYGYSITHWLYGATYQLLGSSPFMIHVFNSMFSCLSGLLVYLIVIRICSHKSSARMAMGLTLFMPSQIMWSVEMLKEPLIQLYVTLMLYLFVEVVVRKKWKYLLLLSVMWYPLGHLRKFTHLMIFAVLVLGALFAFPRRLRTSIMVLLILVGAVLLKIGPGGINSHWESLQQKMITSQIGFMTTGGAWYKYLPDRITQKNRTPLLSPTEFAGSFVRSIGYYLLLPYPFKMFSFNKLPALPQMVVWYFLILVCFLPGSLYLLRYHFRSSVILFVYILVFTPVMALFTGNEGTAFRQRDILTMIYFIPISVGFYNLKGWLASRLAEHVRKTDTGQVRNNLADGA